LLAKIFRLLCRQGWLVARSSTTAASSTKTHR
jgi:hypothetical protein